MTLEGKTLRDSVEKITLCKEEVGLLVLGLLGGGRD